MARPGIPVAAVVVAVAAEAAVPPRPRGLELLVTPVAAAGVMELLAPPAAVAGLAPPAVQAVLVE
jgi:hypothetical protein